MEVKQIVIKGPRANAMAQYLVEHGALLFSINEDGTYTFIEDDDFRDALEQLQVDVRRGFF